MRKEEKKRKPKKPIEDEINELLGIVDMDCINLFFKELYYLFALFDVDEKDDWLEKLVGPSNVREVRLIRTCYIASRLAEHFSSKFCSIKAHHPKFWERLQKYVEDEGLLIEDFEVDESYPKKLYVEEKENLIQEASTAFKSAIESVGVSPS